MSAACTVRTIVEKAGAASSATRRRSIYALSPCCSNADRHSDRRPQHVGLGSHARAQGDEKLVQLLERLDHRIRRPGAGRVESFLRGIELVHDQQRLATLFLEGHRGDWPTLTSFLIGPDEARVRCHFEVRAEERHSIGFELETVRAPDTNIHLTGT